MGAVFIYQYLEETRMCYTEQILVSKVFELRDDKEREKNKIKFWRYKKVVVSKYILHLSLPGAHHLYLMQIVFVFFVKYYK